MRAMFAMAEVGAAFAHEINQPLTALMLYLRAARRLGESPVHDGALPVAAMAILEKAASEAERLAHVIQQIEQLAAQTHPARRLMDVKTLVEEAADFMTQDCPGTFFARQYEPGLPRVLVDPLQIQQLLVSLLDDACAAIRADRASMIRASARSANGAVMIVIEDNRTDQNLAALSLPALASHADLAFAICRRIARNHGGDLVFDTDRSQSRHRATLSLPVPCST